LTSFLCKEAAIQSQRLLQEWTFVVWRILSKKRLLAEVQLVVGVLNGKK
jgi:hypothetical protein